MLSVLSFPGRCLRSTLATQLSITPTDLKADAKAFQNNAQRALSFLSNVEYASMAEICLGIGLSDTPTRTAVKSLIGSKIEEFSDPEHKQRMLYRIPETPLITR